MPYVPEQGDLILLDFNPSNGKEIAKRRPVFVISQKTFNKHMGMAIVAPVTSTIRGIKLEVILPDTLETKGAILIYQLKSVDFISRNAKFLEQTPVSIVEQVTYIAGLLVQKA